MLRKKKIRYKRGYKRGYKNVYKIVKDEEKEAATILLCISASAKTFAPCAVFADVKPPREVINSMSAIRTVKDWVNEIKNT